MWIYGNMVRARGQVRGRTSRALSSQSSQNYPNGVPHPITVGLRGRPVITENAELEESLVRARHVAGQRADHLKSAGLRVEIALRGSIAHAGADGSVDAGDGECRVEKLKVRRTAHVIENSDNRFGRDQIAARQAAAVAHDESVGRNFPIGELSLDHSATAVGCADSGAFKADRAQENLGDLIL